MGKTLANIYKNMEIVGPNIITYQTPLNWENLKRVHAHFRVEHFELAIARIDDEEDSIHGQRCFGDVCGNDAFSYPTGRALKYFCLQITGQLRVDWQNRQWWSFIQFTELLLYQFTCHLEIIFQISGHEAIFCITEIVQLFQFLV